MGRAEQGGQGAISQGFTLVEFAIVLVVIGLLASFGVPRFRDNLERAKAGESLNYLSAVRAAEQRYRAREGTFTTIRSDLDVAIALPKFFRVGAIVVGASDDIEDSWALTLTRVGASSAYGAYTVTFTESGYDAANSTLGNYPQISPIPPKLAALDSADSK